eukprot:CAMPEP_0118698748 /NCGR_PEP_ID=MMETSP0800-20121206/15412_1 /TAXON_ID=210618 ORGANISM="Striatella unipunctata, Strain CCMP2910" /NCGR_SAMPLE_ID=MMETSP0800 /ASSEMBLY_ACC=CAM_ASM_000638 /LENGTH=62 /DNA_ID=CAMNT_0006598681 /DNA_START=13 /DNA_END=201 /DNA_ORIENTATION=+
MPVDGAHVLVEWNWTVGPGYVCLLLATMLKIPVMVCHLLLPTPTIARDPNEQEDYERLYGVG